ncbi:hypothetical protein HJC99_00255 [Candidatus Saccharibacteria bacterium]|nr:hypothetical protein [Candidatus Saccharibacteria bacterium]
MLDSRFLYLAAVIELIGVAAYAFDTFKGNTKPNRVTWLLWTVVPFIAFFAQISEGAGLATILTLAVGLGPLLVLLASFLNKQSYWQVTKFDLICGVISVLALILWYITGKGNVAIIFSMLADFMAAVPTLVKAWKYPKPKAPTPFSRVLLRPLSRSWHCQHIILPLSASRCTYCSTACCCLWLSNFQVCGLRH